MTGRPVSRHVGVVEYRIDGMSTPSRGLLTKRVGWFGKFMVMSMVLSFFGFAFGMRESLIDSINMRYSQTTVVAPPSAAPAKTAPAASLATNIVDLQPTLNKWVFSHQNERWSIVAKSLDGPQFDVSVNSDMLYEAGSLYKLYLTVPLFDQVPLNLQKQTKVDVAGVKMPIQKCVDLMLKSSDNDCAEALGYFVNWTKVDPKLREVKFSHTNFTKSGDALQTSAADAARFLEQLDGGLLPSDARDAVFKSMREQIFRRGIPAGCPGCTVADKVGNVDNVLHDAGVVSYSRGRYVLVIFSENSRDYDEIAKLTGQIHQKILDTIK